MMAGPTRNVTFQLSLEEWNQLEARITGTKYSVHTFCRKIVLDENKQHEKGLPTISQLDALVDLIGDGLQAQTAQLTSIQERLGALYRLLDDIAAKVNQEDTTTLAAIAEFRAVTGRNFKRVHDLIQLEERAPENETH